NKMEFGILLALLIVGFLFVGALFGFVSFFKIRGLEENIRDLQFGQSTSRTPRPNTQKPKPAMPASVKQPAMVRTKTGPASTATAPPPSAKAGKPPKASLGFGAQIEQSLRGNWLIWVAGIALAFGGIFIVQYAAEAGLLGPKTRVLIAILSGLAMIGFARYLQQKTLSSPALATSLAPQVLAGAGLITLYGALYAAFALYGLIGSALAFGLLAGVAVFGLYLALLFGPVLAVFGLLGAFVTPALIGSEQPNAANLFAYVFLVSASGLVLARLKPWRWNAILALAGGLIWPVIWLVSPNGSTQLWVLQLYLPALALFTAALAWQPATQPFTLRGAKQSALAVFTCLAGFIGTGGLALWVVLNANHSIFALSSLGGLAVLALLLSWQREGFSPAVPVLALFSALTLLSWPVSQAAFVGAPEQLTRFLARSDALFIGPSFLSTCFGLAALFGFGGYLASLGQQRRAYLVSTSAMFAPLVLFIAYWRLTGLQDQWPYGAAALALAVVVLVLLEREARSDPGFKKHPGAAAALTLGGSAAVFLVFLTLFSQMWLALALAGQALITALLWHRFKLPILQGSAMALAVLASFRLVVLGEAFDMDIGSWPIVNGLLVGFGGSAVFLAAAAYVFQAGGSKPASKLIQTLHSSALVITVTMISLQIHHLMGKGDLLAGLGFAETGLQISMFAAIALALRWRLGGALAFAPKWTSRIALGLSLLGFVVLACLLGNPWWGGESSPVSGGFLLNALALVYLLPALLYIALGYVFAKHNKPVAAKWLTLVGALAAFLWLTLEIRHGFHTPNMDIGGISDAETYAYSAGWLVFAILLLGLGFWRKLTAVRLGGLVLLALTSVKVFVFDLASLDGLFRGLSFLGLGASLMGIGLLYQKLGGAVSKTQTKTPPQ
ncbi:hypothetical protein MNBD_ALPHA06-2009, partial [hydrothermal vent metagenome]